VGNRLDVGDDVRDGLGRNAGDVPLVVMHEVRREVLARSRAVRRRLLRRQEPDRSKFADVEAAPGVGARFENGIGLKLVGSIHCVILVQGIVRRRTIFLLPLTSVGCAD
jgi:hypothetical protein